MQDDSQLPHHIEHIISRQHGGSDDFENLVLACQRGNLNKGPNGWATVFVLGMNEGRRLKLRREIADEGVLDCCSSAEQEQA
jgi:5-methylcytosine-specific restriction endonuclease McrA